MAQEAKMGNLVLGTAQFGLDYGVNNLTGKTTPEQVKQILFLAKSCGIDSLDTAQAYGDSEEVVGKYADISFDITTKINPSITSPIKLRASLLKSLKLLNRSAIYACYFHNFESYLKHPELLAELEKMKAEGLISKIGFSLYFPKEFDYIVKNNITCDIIQVPYSVLDRRFERVFVKAKKIGIEVHVRSIYLQGLVFKDPDKLGKEFKNAKKSIRKLNALSSGLHLSVGSICLNFATLNKNIEKVVIGIDNLGQLKENIEDLKPEKREQVLQIIRQLDKLSVSNENEILPFKWRR